MFTIHLSSDFNIIGNCYSQDTEVCAKWHRIAPNTSEQCAADSIKSLSDHENLEFYVLRVDGQLAGFIGINGNLLSTFHILPVHRNKEFISFFWKSVKELAKSKELEIRLWNHNKPAKDFIKRAGAYLIDIGFINNQTFVVYKLNLGDK